MSWQFHPYAIALGVTAVIAAALTLVTWRRRAAPGGLPLALLMLAVTEWSLASALEVTAIQESTKILWAKAEYVGAVSSAPLLLIFSLTYSYQTKWLTRRTLLLLWSMPVLIIGLVATNEWHRWIWDRTYPTLNSGGIILHYDYGIGFGLYIGYVYLCVAIATMVLIWAYFRFPRPYRGQVGSLLVAALFPVVAGVLYISRLNPFPDLDIPPVSFTLTGLTLVWGVFRYQLFDLVPVARDALIDSLSDGMLVLDEQNRIADINPAAQRLIGLSAASVIGQHMDQALAVWPDLAAHCRDASETQAEICVDPDAPRYLDLRISPLYDRRRHLTGRLVVLRDITEREQIGQALARSALKMTALYETSLEISSQSDVSTLLGAIVERAVGLLRATMGGLYLLKPDGETLELLVSHNLPRDYTGVTLRLGEGLSGRAAQTGEAMMVEDYSQWEHRSDVFAEIPACRMLAVPLKLKGRVLGAINIADDHKTGLFTQDELRLVSLFADQAAIAIENARLFTEVNRHAEQLAMLNRINLAVTEGLDMRRVLQTLYEQCQQFAAIDTFYVALYDEATNLVHTPLFYDKGEQQTWPPRDIRDRPGLTGHVIQTRQTLYLPDTLDPNAPLPVSLIRFGGEPTRSYVGVPLVLRERVLGVISMQSYQPNAYTPDQIHLLETVATQAAIAIENARLFDETSRHSEQMATLIRIGLTITSGLEMERVLQALDEQCRQVAEVDAFYLAFYDDQKGMIHFPLFRVRDEYRQVAAHDIHTQPGLTGHVIQGRQLVYIHDILAPDPALPPDPIIYTEGESLRSYLGVPLLLRDTVIGVLSIQSYRPDAYSPDQIRLLATIATQATIAIENARLYAEMQQSVDELEHANRQAQEARIAAETASRAKSVFLANMSHELRTPLNAILGFSDLMADAPGLSPEQRENLAIINRSGEHLLSLINGVLDMAKIESGRIVLLEQAFDLARMLDELIEMFRPRAQDKSLSLIVSRTPDVPRYVWGDEGKLRQVLINLLGNAIKFTVQGGVGLRVVWLSGQRTNRLYLELMDTGPGIAPKELEMVFEPFVQLDTGQKSREGTGLGLAISRQFVRLMGGDLTVSSEAGRGSLFKFDVPMRLADAADLPGGLERPSGSRAIGLEPGQPIYRLLVAEDDPANRQMLVRLLTALGFDVQAAEHGLEAMQIWERWQPHLIWMDMRMPIMDGHEATKRIKATTPGQATIIIALTASAFEMEREQILSEGCDGFIRKPFRKDEIVDQLVKHLGVRFRYQETPSEQLPPQELAGLLSQKASSLAGLPADWVANLRQAAVEADSGKVAALVDQIREQEPELAAAIDDWVTDFDFGAILNAIIKSRAREDTHEQSTS